MPNVSVAVSKGSLGVFVKGLKLTLNRDKFGDNRLF
jgi:hypothetical protein